MFTPRKSNLHFTMQGLYVTRNMLVINSVIITLFRQKKVVVVSKLININVSGLPLMIVALASFVVS